MRRFTVVAVLLGCLVLVGCGDVSPSAETSGTPSGTLESAPAQGDAAAVAVCSSNRAMLSSQYSVVQSGASADGDTTFEDVTSRNGATCPSGGTYSWDAATNMTRCSTHGE